MLDIGEVPLEYLALLAYGDVYKEGPLQRNNYIHTETGQTFKTNLFLLFTV